MKMNKKDILGALQKQKIDNGPKNNQAFEKTDFLKKIGNFMPKPDGKGQLLDDSRKNLNTDLANPSSTIKFESAWKTRHDMKDISKKLLAESTILENSQPNAFRLNLSSLVLDKTHAKLGMTRAGESVLVELMYPNANEKITIKLSVDGVEDNIYELSLEDEAYVGNFGASILSQVDEMIKSKEDMGLGDYDSEYYIGAKSGGLTGFSPNWETGAGIGESRDAQRMTDLMALVEADDDEEDLDPEDVEVGTDELGADEIDAGDVNAEEEFDEADFSIDGGDMDFGSGVDMGTFGGGGAASGDMGAGGEEGVNDTGDAFSVEEDVNYMTFREKNDWLNSSIDTMQKLVAASVANKMREGEGVILTSDEILNGSTGIKNDANAEVIDKFLTVYPSLDSIEFKEQDLDRVEEKLSLDDGQFDSWLQTELPGMRGDADVDTTLNNEMFDDFEEMGGEKEKEFDGIGEFDDFIDDTTSDEGDIDDMFTEISNATEEEEEIDPLRKEVESEVDSKELNEFPNI